MPETLRIRAEQLRAFESSMERDMALRLTAHIRRFHNDTTGGRSDEALLACVRAGMKRAHARGLNTEQAIMHFVALMFEIAPDFDLHPVIDRALQSADPERALDRLHLDVPPEEWEAAAARNARAGEVWAELLR